MWMPNNSSVDYAPDGLACQQESAENRVDSLDYTGIIQAAPVAGGLPVLDFGHKSERTFVRVL